MYSQAPSTNSIPTDKATIVINGQRFVLVPEKTFSKIEKLTEELPALRDENGALKVKSANDDKIIAKDTELFAAKDKEADALRLALKAQTERGDALVLAQKATENALKVSEDDRARLEKKVKRYRNYAVVGVIATIATYLIFK